MVVRDSAKLFEPQGTPDGLLNAAIHVDYRRDRSLTKFIGHRHAEWIAGDDPFPLSRDQLLVPLRSDLSELRLPCPIKHFVMPGELSGKTRLVLPGRDS